MHGWGIFEQRFEDAPGLLDAVLAGEAHAVAAHRIQQEHLVWGGGLAALLGELHVERDRLRAAFVGAVGVEDHSHTGGGVELDHKLVGLWAAAPVLHEAQAWRIAEDEAQLGLGDRQILASADEPRHA